jgi:UDP-2,4-diacetamido-2,4,6-trideoxy-beta-L-altropyranose hydrolase
MGHLSRSSALAVALSSKGISPFCLANGIREPIDRDGVRWEPFVEDSLARAPKADVLVLDSYRLPPHGVTASRLVILHEEDPPPENAALVVNAGADPAKSGCGHLYGFSYACLRPAFWGLPHRRAAPRVRRILVTTGSGDETHVATSLADAARAAVPEGNVTLVRGPYMAAVDVAGVETVVSPDSLFPLLLDADLVVTAGGQTLLEAAAVGVPTIGVALTHNQEAQLQRLAQLGAVRRADIAALPAALEELPADHQARRRLAERAQAAVDGYGALRVAFAITQVIESSCG